ncbi:MAG: hypothetical protein NC342_00015 [Pseudoflavonifractor sp.]|nr:hypothetical protein [Alloprevotella sp.]MCM1115912.1 hypothetical protein [Pseudoflavonifractor sp.]
MRIFLLFIGLMMAVVSASAQAHVTIFPNEGCVEDHYEDMSGWNYPASFKNYINAGKAQTLYFVAFNQCYGADTLILDIVCENLGDNFKYNDTVYVEPYHESSRLSFISTGMLNGSYEWETEVTVTYPVGYDFYTYWIYQRLGL